jgi:predicted dehydrogenase
MSNNIKNLNKVLIIGSGYMAKEYAKVLKSLDLEFEVVGRGKMNCKKMEDEFSIKVHSGGLESFLLKNKMFKYSHIINTVNVSFLHNTTKLLIKFGAKRILLEKPGDIYIAGLQNIADLSKKKGCEVLIAYNRRFYSSVNELKNLSKKDGGILSMHFEFTEWIHTINEEDYDKDTLKKWIIGNSSHVIDTALYLIGDIKYLNSNVAGKSVIPWHPSGSIFSGSGASTNNIPFTYHANWLSSGRWSIEVMTSKKKYYLKPMEQLFEQKIGSIEIKQLKIKDDYDVKFKPGIYQQTINFIDNKNEKFCSLNQQIKNIKEIYNIIGNY